VFIRRSCSILDALLAITVLKAMRQRYFARAASRASRRGLTLAGFPLETAIRGPSGPRGGFATRGLRRASAANLSVSGESPEQEEGAILSHA